MRSLLSCSHLHVRWSFRGRNRAPTSLPCSCSSSSADLPLAMWPRLNVTLLRCSALGLRLSQMSFVASSQICRITPTMLTIDAKRVWTSHQTAQNCWRTLHALEVLQVLHGVSFFVRNVLGSEHGLPPLIPVRIRNAIFAKRSDAVRQRFAVTWPTLQTSRICSIVD